MPDLNEKLLQFIWQFSLLKPKPLLTISGKQISIVKPGELNPDAGPDFFNGQIRLDNILLAGNIELHMKTGDWLRHGHQGDRSYDNIILHVVYEHDVALNQNIQYNVEVLELKDLIPENTISAYKQLISSGSKLPCSKQLAGLNNIHFISWLERMTIERLEEKVKRIEQLFKSFNGDYTQTFYSLLLRNFGFKVNGLPFEILARQLPVQVLLKHADNLLQLEALLLGSSGMLDETFSDKYLQNLQNEYVHLKNKYGLVSLRKEIFKFSRLRPANFPGLRLAQFAALIHNSPLLLVSPQDFSETVALKTILKISPSGYWKNHYTLGGNAQEKVLSFGDVSAEIIFVNTIAPFFFFYAKKLLKPALSDRAVAILNSAAFEKNVKTKLFETKKTSCKNAADSQAIIHLYDNYCSKKQCLRCGIATSLLKSS